MIQKEVRHCEIVIKAINANNIVKQQSMVNLLIMKEAIEKELEERGY
jgi:hypothetical protein